MENLSWYEAVNAIAAGSTVTLADWDDSEKTVYYDENNDGVPDSITLQQMIMTAETGYGMSIDAKFRKFLACVTLDDHGQVTRPYHPSQQDFISKTWKTL